jgi:hypothetical protein
VSHRFVAASCCALLGLSVLGCATTTLDGTWIRPGFAGRLQGPVMIVGVARDNTVRHTYEDDIVQKLGARGVAAVRSYEQVPEVLDEGANARLMAAARAAGARYLLSTALVDRELEHVVTQDPAAYAGGYHRWYGAYWNMSYPVQTGVRTYEVYVAETVLTDVGADRIEWTARTRSDAPRDIAVETRAFVDVIVDALTAAGLVGPAG